MKVNLRLIDSETWVCWRKEKIDSTPVRGAALEVELTDGIKDILEQYEGFVEAVPTESKIFEDQSS